MKLILQYIIPLLLLRFSLTFDILSEVNQKKNEDGTKEADLEAPDIKLSVSSCTILVDWTCVESCSNSLLEFNIYWQQSGTEEITNVTVSRSSNYHRITGLLSSQTYTVWVSSVKENGEHPSDPEEATTERGEPRKVRIHSVIDSSDSIKIIWDEPATICPIKGYYVEWNGTAEWDPLLQVYGSEETQDTSLTMYDLIPDATYTITVNEITTDNIRGNVSDPVYVTTLTAAPGPPIYVTSETIDSSSITLNWKTPSAANGIITGYHIWCYLHDIEGEQCGLVSDIPVSGSDDYSYVVTDLLDCGNYSFQIRAKNSAGYGEEATTESRTSPSKPGIILNFQYTEVSATAVNLTWDAIDTHCPIYYRLRGSGTVKWNGDSDDIRVSFQTEGNSYQLQDLIPYTDYLLVISATTGGGVTISNDTVDFGTLEGAASPPTNIISFTVDRSTIVLHWNPPVEENGIILRYHISCRLSELDDECNITTSSVIYEYRVTDLIACGDYTFEISAINAAGVGEAGTTESTTAPEEPPNLTSLTIESTSTTATLTWEPLDTTCPVLYYMVTGKGNIMWSDDTDSLRIAFKTVNNFYTMKGLIPYTSYTINFNATTDGGGTNTLQGTFETLEGIAGPPTNVTSTAVSDSSINLYWSPPVNKNGEILEYHISCRLSELDDECNIATPSVDKMYEVTNLTSCRSYTFEISAVNEAGQGQAGTTNSTTQPEIPPDIEVLGITTLTSTTVTITFDPVETTCPYLYVIEGEGDILWSDDTDVVSRIFEATESTYVIEGLIPWTDYRLGLSAVTDGGSSNPETFSAITLQDVAGPPQFLISSSVDSSTIYLSWSAPLNENGDISHYHISCQMADEEEDICDINTPEVDEIYAITGLKACTNYNFKVYAINGAGNGEKATTKSRTKPEVPPDIQNLVVENITSTTATIIFDPPDTSCPILSYIIKGEGDILSSTDVDVVSVTLEGGESTYVLEGLIPWTDYTLNITAVTDGGSTNPLEFNFVTLKEYVDPEAPTIMLSVISACVIMVDWTCDENCSDSLLEFIVYWQRSGSEETFNETVSKNTNFYEIYELLASESYTVWVSSVKENGQYRSNSVFGTTEKGEPNKVTGLTTAADPTDTTIDIKWDQSTNICPIKGYYIEWNGSALWDQSVEMKGSQYTQETFLHITDLTPYSNYNFTVNEITTDEVVGKIFTPITVQTMEGVAEPPQFVISSAVNSSTIYLYWSPPLNKNGNISSYHISCQIEDDASDFCNLNATVVEEAYTITGLNACTNYNFEVCAINGAGFGKEANTKSRTSPEAPPDITNLRTADITSTTVTITFDPPDTTCPILSYIIKGEGDALSDDDVDDVSMTVEGGESTYVLTDLRASTNYTLNITGVTDGGSTKPEQFGFITLDDNMDPEAPSITVNVASSCSLLVNWICSEVCVDSLDMIIIYWQQLESEEITNATATKDTDFYVIFDLLSSRSYNVWVSSVKEHEEHPSVSVKITMPNGEPKGVSELTTAQDPTDTTAELNWDPSTNICPIKGYYVEWNGFALWDQTIKLKGSQYTQETFLRLTGLTPYSTYTITVNEVTTDDLIGNITTPINVQTVEGLAGPPQFLISSTANSSMVYLYWNPPSEVNGVIESYHISCEISPDPTDLCDINTSDVSLAFPIKGLTACTYYTFKVYAINQAGNGEEASTRSRTSPEAPPDITNLGITSITETTATISFDPPDTTCPILSYIIKGEGDVINNDDVDVVSKTFEGGESTYVLEGLMPWTDYTLNITAVTDGGTTNPEEFSFQTLSDYDPEAPTIALNLKTLCSILVDWTCSDLCRDSLDEFKVYWQETGSTKTNNEVVSFRSNYYTITGLNASQSYTVWVSSVKGDVEHASDKESTITKEGVSFAINDVTATENGNVIDVEWTASVNPCPIKGYYVEWSATANWDPKLIAADSSETEETYLTIWDYVPDAEYTITVNEITTDDKIGNVSDPQPFKTTERAPGPPIYVTSETIDSSSVTLNWKTPSAANGIITGYQISCTLSDLEGDQCGAVPQIDVLDSGDYYYNVTELLDCGNYTFSIRAVNSAGSGQPATTESRTNAGRPGLITNFEATAVGSTTVNLTWEISNTHCPAIIYRLRGTGTVLWDDDREELVALNFTTEGNSYQLTTLIPYSFYSLRLSARTEGGNTTSYNNAEFQTMEGVPGPPASVTVSAVSSSVVELIWTPPIDKNGIISRYHITCKLIESEEDQCNIFTTKVSALITDLLSCQKYTFSVQAINNAGTGEAATTQARTGGDQPPEISNFRVIDVTSTTANLAWNPMACSVSYYTLKGEEDVQWINYTDQVSLIFETENNFYHLKELIPYTRYTLKITAANEEGSFSSDSISFQTLEDIAGPPLSVTSSVISSSRVEVKWSPTVEKNGVLKGYHIGCSVSGIEDDSCDIFASVDDVSTSITNLQACGNYTFQVQAINGVGLGDAATTIAETALDKPPEITNFEYTNLTSRMVTFTWDPVKTMCSFSYYIDGNGDILWSEDKDNYGRSFSTNNNYVTLDDLTPFTRYTFSLTATNNMGSTDPVYQTFDTLEESPDDIKFLNSSSVDSSTVSLYWTPPYHSNGIITDYHISCQILPDLKDYCNITTTEVDKIYYVTGLEPNTNYTFEVYAINDAGNGEAVTTTSKTEPYKAPIITEITALSTNVLRVVWTCDAYCSDDSLIAFKVYWQQSGLDETSNTNVGKMSNYYDIEDLPSAESYTVWVSSVKTEGEFQSDPVESPTVNKGTPEITHFIVTEVTSTSAKLMWDPMPTNYPVQYTLQGKGEFLFVEETHQINLNFETENNFFYLKNLIPHTRYTLKITAAMEGSSAGSDSFTFDTLEDNLH